MKRSTLVNWLLVIAVVALAAAPMIFVQGEFGGADGRATEVIAESHPAYEPWFSSVYEPSAEIASGLFALQAALGAGVLGYYFGVARTSRRLRAAERPTGEASEPAGDCAAARTGAGESGGDA